MVRTKIDPQPKRIGVGDALNFSNSCRCFFCFWRLETNSLIKNGEGHSNFNGRGTGVGHDGCPTKKTFFAAMLAEEYILLHGKSFSSRPAIVNTLVRMLHKTMYLRNCKKTNSPTFGWKANNEQVEILRRSEYSETMSLKKILYFRHQVPALL